MDKYEYKVRLDELKELVQLKNYRRAAELADEINWNKVRNAKTLSMVADIYEAVERYDACQSVLMQAYAHTSASRAILSRLTDIAIKSKNVRAAEEYYNEFLELAPGDSERYVFAYKIACLKDAPLTDRIAVLEELKEKEYTEMWAYELAVLYAQADMREQCVETCDELILWFGDGEYVERALDLKRTFQPLTPSQEAKFQRIRARRGETEVNVPLRQEFTADVASAVGVADEASVSVSKFNTKNLQEEISRSMQQIMDATEENTVRDRLNSIRKIVQDIPYLETDEDLSYSSQREIQHAVDSGLKSDFQEKLAEENVYGQSVTSYDTYGSGGDTSGMSIEEILADWEKTKLAAQQAMEAANQKKLDMEKQQAIAEAGGILQRLEELMPILSASSEEISDAGGNTVAGELLAADPVITDPELAAAAAAEAAASGRSQEERPGTVFDFFDEDKQVSPSLQDQDTRPLQQMVSRVGSAANRTERNPLDPMADVESLEEWSEEDETALEAELAQELKMEGLGSLGLEEPAAPEPEMPQDAASQPSMQADLPKEIAEDDFFDEEEEIEGIEEALLREALNEQPEETPQPLNRQPEEETQPLNRQPEETPQPMPEPTPMPQTTEGYEQETFHFEPTEPLNASMNAASPVALTDEMKEIFSYFIAVPGMPEKLSRVLGVLVQSKGTSVTSATGNLIVQGEEGSGKTILATDLVKAAQKAMGLDDAKIGKINASALNKRGFASFVPKIAGGYLIVEDAGILDMQTVEEMSQVMDQNTGGMTVILEDDSFRIRQVLTSNPAFAAKFTAKIDTPVFTIDELVSFGKSYATEQECVIEEMAVLALYNRINNIQTLDRPTMLAEVKEIIDQAIDRAESGGIKKLFAKKYDDDDFLILHEEDFE